jgi:hypothetical protein
LIQINQRLLSLHCRSALDGALRVHFPVSSFPLDQALSWLRASEVISIALTEFYRQMAKRQRVAA